MSRPAKKYAEVGLADKLSFVGTILCLPAAIAWGLLTTTHLPHNKSRSLKRILGDVTLKFLVRNTSVEQLQWSTPSTMDMYAAWTKANGLPGTVDEIGEDARLLWIGEKRLDRVILFAHGGGFVLPASDYSVSFWRYVQLELEKKGIHVGIALLNYTIVPTANFPTQLKQLCRALEFLLDAGVKPENLQLTGDSAGGNLILQLVSQILHPLPNVPLVPTLSAPLRGILLISPWTNLTADSPSHSQNGSFDSVGPTTLSDWGSRTKDAMTDPEREAPFVEAVRAPEGWFAGIDKLVERVLVTAGGVESLRDDVVLVGEMLKKEIPGTEVVVQPGGMHEDMYLDFSAKEDLGRLGTLTPLIVEWVAAGFHD
ncbi:Alpha/Beta hydrolase protein [Roridomyces roridus]|uniref:Alpha/Beta hydrolase protein n=1 Tax=Roridomyces roridus TaxID=1738132 RepID=A0AAD7BF68_9AGAR|nr:Alpha/Beta hydrolase protein [Roridomyces roridus]